MAGLRTHNRRRWRATSRQGDVMPVCYGEDRIDPCGLLWCFEKVRHGKFVRHFPKPFFEENEHVF